MPTLQGVLRAARAEVAPQLPELASYMLTAHADSRNEAVADALKAAIERQDVDPATISPGDLNKTERFTIAAYLIGDMESTIVEGQGREAAFIPPALRRVRPGSGYEPTLNGAIRYGAEVVEARYSNGPDRAHQWLPVVSERFARLGEEMRNHTDVYQLSRDGTIMHHALRSVGITRIMMDYAGFISHALPNVPAPERTVAAHDLNFMPLIVAGQGIARFLTNKKNGVGFRVLPHGVRKNLEKDRYELYVPPSVDEKVAKAAWRAVFRRDQPDFVTMPAATLMCPAHAVMQGKDGTSLQRLVPAATNLLPQRNLL